MRGPRHSLRRRLVYTLTDVDALDAGASSSRFLGVGRRRLLSVLAQDHGEGDANGLGAWARRTLAQRGVVDECARIDLLTLPRMWSFLFNPISVFFIYDKQDRLHHLLYEVNNTFGGRKFYLAHPDPNDPQLSHACKKTFHVSPFFGIEGAYKFSLRPPDERLRLSIDYVDGDGFAALKARLTGVRRPATDMQSLRVFLGFPLMTIGVFLSIHWEALKMILKGAALRPAPKRSAIRGDKPERTGAIHGLSPARLEQSHE